MDASQVAMLTGGDMMILEWIGRAVLVGSLLALAVLANWAKQDKWH
jgi:hypothetical protein